MSMPTKEDQIATFRSEMKYSLSDIMKNYKKGNWNNVNDLTAMFPETPYSNVDCYISPDIKVPQELEKVIDKIAYSTQTPDFAKNNYSLLTKQLFPNLVKKAKAEKLM